MMRLIVGLGNPGNEYEETRHNLGFQVVERMAKERGIAMTKKKFRGVWGEGTLEGQKIGFLLPQTYMNRSGEAVSEAVQFFGIDPSALLVVHDDIDLALGKVKQDFDAGSAGHRGVASITEWLGTKKFHRLRLGIGRPAIKEEVESYVLDHFSEEEKGSVTSMREEAIKMIFDWARRS